MKKKILFVINTLGGAGAEMALIELLKRLDPGQYACSLYVLTGQGEMRCRIPDAVRVLNKTYSEESVLSKKGRCSLYKTVGISSLRHASVFRNFGYLCRNLVKMLKKRRIQPDKLLWRVLSDGGVFPGEEYDLAVSFLEGGSAYFVADHVKAKKKAAFIHIDYGEAGYTRSLDRDCYLKFDKIFTVSGEVKEHFLSAYPECASRTEIFHNILDVEMILQRAKEPGGFTDGYKGVRILTVGRLTAQKAYEVAVDAMKLLKDDGIKARWYVLGEGDQRSVLEKKIRQLSLTEDFILAGAVENPFPYYAQTDLYVHATRFEGKSIAIQEAQILGCAVLASNCSGNKEQLTDGRDGRLCELSAEAVRDGIKWMLQHPEETNRYGEEAARRMRNPQQDVGKLLALLDEQDT